MDTPFAGKLRHFDGMNHCCHGTGNLQHHADFKDKLWAMHQLTEVVHKITWWVKDCQERESAPMDKADITINHGPKIDKNMVKMKSEEKILTKSIEQGAKAKSKESMAGSQRRSVGMQ